MVRVDDTYTLPLLLVFSRTQETPSESHIALWRVLLGVLLGSPARHHSLGEFRVLAMRRGLKTLKQSTPRSQRKFKKKVLLFLVAVIVRSRVQVTFCDPRPQARGPAPETLEAHTCCKGALETDSTQSLDFCLAECGDEVGPCRSNGSCNKYAP